MASRKINSNPRLVDARLLLAVLNHIDNHGGVAIPELRELLGLSRATVARLISNSRQQYGVVVTWRRDNSLPSNGEYTVDDWGVFSPVKVRDFFKNQKIKGYDPFVSERRVIHFAGNNDV